MTMKLDEKLATQVWMNLAEAGSSLREDDVREVLVEAAEVLSGRPLPMPRASAAELEEINQALDAFRGRWIEDVNNRVAQLDAKLSKIVRKSSCR
jgi:hypothetical protein